MKVPTLLLAALALLFPSTGSAEEKILRAGLVGLDTSHVPAFTKLFNDPNAEGDLAWVKVVAGYPGGTDMPASKDRVEKFTEQVREMGVEIVATIPELLEKVDVVLLESVDGRIHLEEARQILPSGKPVFIDKPLAGTLPEAIAIFELARRHGAPLFSSSSTRFGSGLVGLEGNEELGELLGATTWGPCSYQSGTPDLFFYAIHGVEALYTVMGPGCESVSRVKGPVHDQTTGVWSDGRLGVYRGIVRGKAAFGATAYGTNGIVQVSESPSYANLCRAIATFFRTGVPPVSEAETLELFAFMEAADESLRQEGRAVALAEVLEKAKEEASKLVD
jgi:hypothetical protein